MTDDRSRERRMYDTLRRIARHYMTPKQIRRGANMTFGCEPEEALEMAYENIQAEADSAIKGMRRPP